ncbi:unnamed protein product, partial [Rotaria magnacalcarata]
MLLTTGMETTKSSRVSLLKSPTAIEVGMESVEYAVCFAKEPLPYPRSTFTLLPKTSVTTTSSCMPWFKSQTAI